MRETAPWQIVEKFAPLSDSMLRKYLRSVSPENRSAAKFAVRYFPRDKGHAAALRFVSEILASSGFTSTDESATWALMENLCVTVKMLPAGARDYEQAELFV